MQALNAALFKIKPNQSLTKNFDKIEIFLETDYDRENPVTKDRAIKDYI